MLQALNTSILSQCSFRGMNPDWAVAKWRACRTLEVSVSASGTDRVTANHSLILRPKIKYSI